MLDEVLIGVIAEEIVDEVSPQVLSDCMKNPQLDKEVKEQKMMFGY